jgi:hypothetical protein
MNITPNTANLFFFAVNTNHRVLKEMCDVWEAIGGERTEVRRFLAPTKRGLENGLVFGRTGLLASDRSREAVLISSKKAQMQRVTLFPLFEDAFHGLDSRGGW